ncbi:FAD-dependent oxidoreductase [Spirillospora sp. NPDC127200]
MSRTVAVIGGGYGGAAVAKALESEADVVLIDPRDAFVNAAASLRGADRVLILGAGPVGLELAGEIKEVWPDKRVTVTDPAGELLPGFEPEVVADLRGRLDALGVEVRLGTALAAQPDTGPGLAGAFTVATTGGDEITADIWFRAHGTRTNSDYLADGRLTGRTPQGRVPVTATLNVRGNDHVYAVGDITDVAEAKMAGYAMQHAEVVARNITAQLNGEPPTAEYRPLDHPMILLPLGTTGGVGQLPSPDGPFVAPSAMVSEYKGADLFTGRFVEQFGPTA